MQGLVCVKFARLATVAIQNTIDYIQQTVSLKCYFLLYLRFLIQSELYALPTSSAMNLEKDIYFI